MKSHPFTRPTIVAAVEFLGEMLTQAKFDQLAVRLGLDDEIPPGPAKSVTAKSALLARVVNQRAAQIVSTLDGPVTLAEAAVREAVGVTLPQHAKAEQERLLRGLSDEDHSTFRLHLGLVTGRTLLRRLNNGR